MIDCVFCQIAHHQSPAQVVYEDERFMAFLDKFPQTRGHLQLIPKKHYRWVYEIPQIGEFFELAQKIIRVIIPVLEADHVTLATFGHEVHHAHLWIVPQYNQTVDVYESFDDRRVVDDQELAKLLKKSLDASLKRQKSK